MQELGRDRFGIHAFVVVVGRTHRIGRRPILALALRELVCLHGQERGGVLPRESWFRAAKKSSNTAASAYELAKSRCGMQHVVKPGTCDSLERLAVCQNSGVMRRW